MDTLVYIAIIFNAFSMLVVFFLANVSTIFKKYLRRCRNRKQQDISQFYYYHDLLTAKEYLGGQGALKWRRVYLMFDAKSKTIDVLDVPTLSSPDDDETTVILRRIYFGNDLVQLLNETRFNAENDNKSETWRCLNEAALMRLKRAAKRDADDAFILHEAADYDNRLVCLALRDKSTADLTLKFVSENAANCFIKELTRFTRDAGLWFYRNPSNSTKIFENAATIEGFRKELPNLLRSVLSLDNNFPPNFKSALISRAEFAAILRTPQDHPYTKKAFEQMDSDDDGFIKVAVLLDWFAKISSLSLKDRFQAIFQFFDSNQDGFLSYEELVQVVVTVVPSANHKELGRFFEDVLSNRCHHPASSEQITLSISLHELWPIFQYHFGKSVINNKLESSSPASTPSPELNESSSSDNKTGGSLVLPCFSYGTRLSTAIFTNRRQLFWGLAFCQLEFALILAEIMLNDAIQVLGYASLSITTLTLFFMVLFRCRRTLTQLRNTGMRIFFPFASLVPAEQYLSRLHFLAMLGSAADYISRHGVKTTWQLGLIVGAYLLIFSLLFSRRSVMKIDFLKIICREVVIVTLTIAIYGYLAATFLDETRLTLHLAALILSFLAFTVDRIFCLKTRYYGAKVISSHLLPSSIMCIQLEKLPGLESYKPGQYVNLCAPDVDRDGYRPFSITSSPDEDTLSFHVMPVGPWSRRLAKQTTQGLTLMNIEGPFSGVAVDNWHQCDVAVLFGYGIVATPFASLLKHIRSEIIQARHSDQVMPFKCLNVYFIFITGQSSEWFNDVIEQLERVDDGGFVNCEMYYPESPANYDVRAMVHYQEANKTDDNGASFRTTRNALTRLRARVHFGWPNLDAILRRIVKRNSTARRINVTTSAPTNLVFAMESAVERINQAMATPMASPVFNHRYESL